MSPMKRIQTLLANIDATDKALLTGYPAEDQVGEVEELRLLLQRARLVLKLGVDIAIRLKSIPTQRPPYFQPTVRLPRVRRVYT